MRRVIITCLVLATPLAADMLSFDSAEEWAQWQQPFGLVQVGEQGQLSLVKFRKDINLIEDAHLFVHETRTRGDAVAGGLWQAGSNEADAPLAIDGDPTTYWQPSPDDAREDWFITIDLGRAALAREIRLKFPDQEGARPFRQFRVFTTSGVRIAATDDLFLYRQAFRTTRPNAESEIAMFSPGYPAQVELRSAFINLGEVAGDGRPKVIKGLHWDADLPPGTRMQLRSRSGNALAPVFTFRNKLGEEITEEKWKSSPKVLRGPIDTTLVVGEDWDTWSNVYQFSGEAFKSDSPRRFMLLEMILSTDDPAIAPTVNSVSVEYENALVQGARGSVAPREASPNQDTRFTYTLWPETDELDSGFDLMRFTIPEPVDLQSVSVMVGPEPVVPATLDMQADSLLIALPQVISGDSLQVSFTTRLLQNATVFALDLGSSEASGLWQSVEAAERRSNIVMLPELTSSSQLISDLQLASATVTPNGDGINDQLEVRFVAFKVEGTEPRVEVFDLAGRQIAVLTPSAEGSQRLFTWDGRDIDGASAALGLYVLRVNLGADAGNDTAFRTIAVAY